MGISISPLLKKMYTKWFFLVGMVYLSSLLHHLCKVTLNLVCQDAALNMLK